MVARLNSMPNLHGFEAPAMGNGSVFTTAQHVPKDNLPIEVVARRRQELQRQVFRLGPVRLAKAPAAQHWQPESLSSSTSLSPSPEELEMRKLGRFWFRFAAVGAAWLGGGKP